LSQTHSFHSNQAHQSNQTHSFLFNQVQLLHFDLQGGPLVLGRNPEAPPQSNWTYKATRILNTHPHGYGICLYLV